MSIWLNNILCWTAANSSNTESLRFYQHHEYNLAYRAEKHSRLQLVWLNLHTLNIIQPSLDILISGKNIFTFFKDSKFVLV